MIKRFYNLAQKSADIAGAPIRAEWIYSQWVHESRRINEDGTVGKPFDSDLARENHNLGGVCQKEPNDTPQPDGNQYYINFPDFEAYADYFGRYLRLYREDGIYEAKSVDDYIVALKNGGYFGDDLDAYLADVRAICVENFGEAALSADIERG